MYSHQKSAASLFLPISCSPKLKIKQCSIPFHSNLDKSPYLGSCMLSMCLCQGEWSYISRFWWLEDNLPNNHQNTCGVFWSWSMSQLSPISRTLLSKPQNHDLTWSHDYKLHWLSWMTTQLQFNVSGYEISAIRKSGEL